MPSKAVIAIADVLQSAVPFISLVAYIPQWRKLKATRSSEDISLRAWLLWSMTASFSCFYAIVHYLANGRGLALVFSTATSFLFIVSTVYLIAIHRRR